jgi:hypothetical protein
VRLHWFCAFISVACASPQDRAAVPTTVSYTGGDGSSCAEAIQVVGAPNERAGVEAEYAWLAHHHPNGKVAKQALVQCGDRPADRITVLAADGTTQDVHFDISDFFGKF